MTRTSLLWTTVLSSAILIVHCATALAQPPVDAPGVPAQPPSIAPGVPQPAPQADTIADQFLPAPASALQPPLHPSDGYTFDSALDGSGGYGNIWAAHVGNLPDRFDVRIMQFPDEPVRNQGTSLGYWETEFSASVPVWQDPANDLLLSAHVRGEFFNTGAMLPDTHQPFPNELWNIGFGTTYRHQFDNGWISGVSVNVGSASDQPFNSINEMTAGVNAFLRVPSGDHNAWMFTLTYSADSELPFPIPGVAYVYQPSDNLHINIGLPFLLMYRPIDDVTLDFSYMLLRTVHARATYRLSPHVRIYTAYDWSNEGYFLADRPSDNDRLYYYDMRLTGGLQYVISQHATFDMFGGYVFDRYYFEGSSSSNTSFNRIDVGAGPFAGIRLNVRF